MKITKEQMILSKNEYRSKSFIKNFVKIGASVSVAAIASYTIYRIVNKNKQKPNTKA